MSDRKFYMAKGATYIEKQVNYVKGNQYFGKKEDEDDTTEEKVKNKISAIVYAIEALVNEGEITLKKDFSIIKKAIDDMALFDKFTNDSMLAILKKCELPTSLKMESDSSLKNGYSISGKLPQWKISLETPEEAERILELGKSFLDIYNTYQ